MAGAVSSLSFSVMSTAGFLLAGLATRSSLSATHHGLFVLAGSASASAGGGGDGGNIAAESTAESVLEGESGGEVCGWVDGSGGGGVGGSDKNHLLRLSVFQDKNKRDLR